MSTELATPDIRQVITDRIKATFVSLIPDDQWEKLVSSQINAFSNASRDHYGNQKPAELNELIRAELKSLFLNRLKEELAKPEYWSGDERTPSAFVKDYLSANMDAILQAFFAGMIGDGLRNLQSWTMNELGRR